MTEHKVKKAWYKKWWAITLFVFIGLGVLSNLIDDKPDQSQLQALKTPTDIKSSIDTEKVVSSPTTSTLQKSLVEMFPKREDIPTEFRTDTPHNITFQEYPEGFIEAVRIKPTKIVGTSGLIEIDFNIIKFDSEQNARKYHTDFVDRIKKDGGYTEIDIDVPSKAECFSFTEDYGYEARFATSNCLKGNLEYQVLVTSTYTLEKPQKYLKDMMILLDNRINK